MKKNTVLSGVVAAILSVGLQSAVAQSDTTMFQQLARYANMDIHIPPDIHTQKEFETWIAGEEEVQEYMFYRLDLKNGYLTHSFGDGPCGCAASGESVAYRKADGSYLYIGWTYESCAQTHSYRASETWADILPAELNRSFFYRPGTQPDTSAAVFYIAFDLPQKGTRTTLRTRMIPFGFQEDSTGDLLFQNYQNGENRGWYFYERIGRAVQETEGKLEDRKVWNEQQLEDLAEFLIQEMDQEEDREDIHRVIRKMYAVYQEYRKLEPKSITLDWDRQQGRFRIVEVAEESWPVPDNSSIYPATWPAMGRPLPIADGGFLLFLATAPYLIGMC